MTKNTMILKLKNIYHLGLAWLGKVIYRNPSKELFVIGVTGTKGKTSTVEFLTEILKGGGMQVASMSSVYFRIHDSIERNTTGNTMPGRFFIQRFLRQAVSAGCSHVVLEVTSQGVLQHRHNHIEFDAAIFTCLHPEHIEAHGSFEAYRDSKVQFFRDVALASAKPEKFFIINANSQHARYFEDPVRDHGRLLFYTREKFAAEYIAKDGHAISQWFMSDFNLENAAAAATMAGALGVSREVITQTLEIFHGVPGRLEFVRGFFGGGRDQASARTAVIDYAHTPDSLEAVHSFLKQQLPKQGRLICVFGSYGEGRDKWKRPKMGAVAAKYCDEIILTNEGPGDENPKAIIEQIRAGIPAGKKPIVILDRKAAIQEALTLAKSGDLVALTGKGHEHCINFGHGKKIPWDERAIVQEFLK